jgi:thiol-disulfide isomerase/thioredoxin
MSSNRYYKTYGQLASESESKKFESTTSSRVISAENPEMMRQILSKNMFVVVDIFGSWCGPCMKFKPVYEELASSPDLSYFKFLSIDIDNTYFN